MGNRLERPGQPPSCVFMVKCWVPGNPTKDVYRVYVQEAHANNYRVKMSESGYKTEKFIFVPQKEEQENEVER